MRDSLAKWDRVCDVVVLVILAAWVIVTGLVVTLGLGGAL